MKCILAAGTVVASLAAGSAAAAAPPQPPSGTLKFVERSGFFKFHDTGRKGPSVGDTLVISSDLLTGGKRIGTLRATCVVTGRGSNEPPSECTGTFFLPGGTIEGQVGMKGGNGLTTNIAVVGGTGRYAGARGYVVSVSRGANSKFSDDTVTFMP